MADQPTPAEAWIHPPQPTPESIARWAADKPGDPFAWSDPPAVLASFPIIGAERPNTVVDVIVRADGAGYNVLEHAGSHIIGVHGRQPYTQPGDAILGAIVAAGWGVPVGDAIVKAGWGHGTRVDPQ